MDERVIERLTKYGYLFMVSYDGRKFDCFDENPGRKSVKGEFIRRMKMLEISWAGGVQQGGRTDAGVSAENNCFYFTSLYSGDFSEIIRKFNEYGNEVFIKRYYKTLPQLVIPDEVESRTYEYRYKLSKKDLCREEIDKKCEELSGTYDVSIFSDAKGSRLKEKIREVKIIYDGKKFIITGNSFMPKQIRIMVNYILREEKIPAPASPLSLTALSFKPEFERKVFTNHPLNSLNDIRIVKTEKIDDILVLYVSEQNKGEIIGINGENIKMIRRTIGKAVVKCL